MRRDGAVVKRYAKKKVAEKRAAQIRKVRRGRPPKSAQKQGALFNYVNPTDGWMEKKIHSSHGEGFQ